MGATHFQMKNEECKYRNGAARSGLQHETSNAHSGRWRIDGSDPRLRQPVLAIWSGCQAMNTGIFTQPGP